MEKICCTRGPLIFLSRIFPINRPKRDPPPKGMAIDKSSVPDAREIAAPPADTIASTPKEVATMAFMGRSVNFFREGTMMKPPPTPSSPDKNPAHAPANINALAHGTVQINFPMDISSWHGGGLVNIGALPAIICVA